MIKENLLLKQQLVIHSRSRQRAPNLSTGDRTLLGFFTLFLNPRRITRSAILIRPSTLLSFHKALKKRKYRLLYSPRGGTKRGPKGPSREVIDAIVEMKRRNPRYGCPRITQQINLAFGLKLDKDVLRRILANHYKPEPNSRGPYWLTTAGHAKDSLWSVDVFRCESILLKSHWVMVIMDQYTRSIIGFAVHAGNVDGPTLCRMFNDATTSPTSATYDGRSIVADYFSCQWQLEIGIRHGQAGPADLIAPCVCHGYHCGHGGDRHLSGPVMGLHRNHHLWTLALERCPCDVKFIFSTWPTALFPGVQQWSEIEAGKLEKIRRAK